MNETKSVVSKVSEQLLDYLITFITLLIIGSTYLYGAFAFYLIFDWFFPSSAVGFSLSYFQALGICTLFRLLICGISGQVFETRYYIKVATGIKTNELKQIFREGFVQPTIVLISAGLFYLIFKVFHWM